PGRIDRDHVDHGRRALRSRQDTPASPGDGRSTISLGLLGLVVLLGAAADVAVGVLAGLFGGPSLRLVTEQPAQRVEHHERTPRARHPAGPEVAYLAAEHRDRGPERRTENNHTEPATHLLSQPAPGGVRVPSVGPGAPPRRGRAGPGQHDL